MKNYHFIQGFLIGVVVWGAISVGLRYVHYQCDIPVPRVVMAPGKTVYAFKDTGRESEFRQFTNVIETRGWSWEAIKDLISVLANIATLITPIASLGASFVIWRKQKRMITNV
jgi:hypothetical protein